MFGFKKKEKEIKKFAFKNRIAYLRVPPNSSSVIEFEFEGSHDEIIDWTASCNCTNVKLVNNKLIVTYNNGDSPTFEKQINVYLKDPECDLMITKNGVSDYNPLHRKEFLKIVGITEG